MNVDDAAREASASSSSSDGASISLSIWCCGVDQCSREVQVWTGHTPLQPNSPSLPQGMAACASCVIEAARWLLANPDHIPSSADTMCEILHRGASTWRAMCADAALLARFPDGMFEFDTALQHYNASLGNQQDTAPSWSSLPLRVCRERSLVGFFRPPGSCAALDGLLEGSLCDTMLWEVRVNGTWGGT